MPNRLAAAASPYLRQHADNPVDWYPWGPEALTAAREQQKPILLSVGYAACHWCHVMAHESFEDPATAALMNELFINVKVDREERPDIDDIYMSAVQAMTGHGGWPMTVFLTPDTKPFFAGTYFPPEDRGGMPSFHKVMTSVAQAWSERPDDVVNQAERLAAAAARDIPPADASPQRDVLVAAYGSLAATADRVNGGFGGAPKFPQAPTLEFLLRIMGESWAPQAREVLARTLGAMARGGIYDHLGGGFARYSVDSVWLVPHFEKMLYDNALLARLYGRAAQETGSGALRAVAHETLEYMLADLALPAGGFASAEDADSEGEEGKFYVFDYDEFERLTEDDAAHAGAVLGVTPEGNFEGSNILHAARPVEDVAAETGTDPDAVAAAVGRAKTALRAARAERVRPALDDKVVTAWNGLAVRALAEVGRISGRPDFVDAARRNARFVLAELRRPDGRLLRSWREGVVSGPGFLEDYGAYAMGLYTLYMATGETEWYEEARRLVDDALDLFWADGAFYATGHDAERLITRPRDLMDNPSPAGGSLLAEALLMTAHFTGEGIYFDRVESSLQAGGRLMEQYPAAVGYLLAVLHSSLVPPQEVAVVGGDGAGALTDVIWERFRPHVFVAPAASADSAIPLLAGRSAAPDGSALAYVCRRFVCRAPAATADVLRRELE